MAMVLPLFCTGNAFRMLCRVNIDLRNLEELASVNIEIQIKTCFALTLSGSHAHMENKTPTY